MPATNANRHWNVYSKESPAVRPATHAERMVDPEKKEGVRITEVVWCAETRLDSGAKYVAGPVKSEAVLRQEMADCERRWNTPTNPNPNGDISPAEEAEQKRVRDENEALRLLRTMTPDRAEHIFNTAHGFFVQDEPSKRTFGSLFLKEK